MWGDMPGLPEYFGQQNAAWPFGPPPPQTWGAPPVPGAPPPQQQVAMNDNPGNKLTLDDDMAQFWMQRQNLLGQVDRSLYGDEVGRPANNNPKGLSIKPLQPLPQMGPQSMGPGTRVASLGDDVPIAAAPARARTPAPAVPGILATPAGSGRIPEIQTPLVPTAPVDERRIPLPQGPRPVDPDRTVRGDGKLNEGLAKKMSIQELLGSEDFGKQLGAIAKGLGLGVKDTQPHNFSSLPGLGGDPTTASRANASKIFEQLLAGRKTKGAGGTPQFKAPSLGGGGGGGVSAIRRALGV